MLDEEEEEFVDRELVLGDTMALLRSRDEKVVRSLDSIWIKKASVSMSSPSISLSDSSSASPFSIGGEADSSSMAPSWL